MEKPGLNQDNNEPSKERLRRASNSKLPKLDYLDPDIKVSVRELLRRATTMKTRISESCELLEEIEAELAAFCETYNLPGMRDGLNCFEYFGWQTRKTLSKEALLALGVSAEIIKQAYVESKPFLSTRVNPFDVE